MFLRVVVSSFFFAASSVRSVGYSHAFMSTAIAYILWVWVYTRVCLSLRCSLIIIHTSLVWQTWADFLDGQERLELGKGNHRTHKLAYDMNITVHYCQKSAFTRHMTLKPETNLWWKNKGN